MSDSPELLTQTLRYALEYIAGLETVAVDATASLTELRSRLDKPLPATQTAPAQVLEDLVMDVKDGLTASTSGRFFGWVVGGVTPVALAADWLTSTWDQNAGMYQISPAAAVVEEVCGRWLLELLRLPPTSSFALVTGCQMAHVTCLAAARNAVLHSVGYDVEERGLFGAPHITVLAGAQRHGTIERALRILGLGKDSILDLPVNESGQLNAETLRQALKAVSGPCIVLLQAGDLHTGSFDPFLELMPIAKAHNAWVHVDGAFGLWAATSPAHESLTAGVELADSWATDGHKWLNVPYDCGYAFVADRDAHFRAMSHKAAYLAHSDVARDQIDFNPEYSRRARGFCTYAAIASLGKSGIAEIVDNCCEAAQQIVNHAGKLDGVQVLHRPQLNQGLLRFLDMTPNATSSDHDRRTEEVVTRIVSSGEALFGCTTWHGQRCMRVSVSGWNTTQSDVDRAVAAITAAL